MASYKYCVYPNPIHMIDNVVYFCPNEQCKFYGLRSQGIAPLMVN